MFKKYYKILGLELNASYEEIREAYKRLVLKYHPDKSKSEQQQRKSKQSKSLGKFMKRSKNYVSQRNLILTHKATKKMKNLLVAQVKLQKKTIRKATNQEANPICLELKLKQIQKIKIRQFIMTCTSHWKKSIKVVRKN